MMCILPFIVLIALLLSGGASFVAGECSDPLAAIRTTLDCVEAKNVTCASDGYDGTKFRKLHNGVDTNTVISDDGSFWEFTFALLDVLELNYNFQANVGTNSATVRYVERVVTSDGTSFGLPPSDTYPWNQTYLQHEHALVTVDDDCRMILWDQYGDNEEQDIVDKASIDIILCIIGIYPPVLCGSTQQTNESVTKSTKKQKENKISKQSKAHKKKKSYA